MTMMHVAGRTREKIFFRDPVSQETGRKTDKERERQRDRQTEIGILRDTRGRRKS